MRKLVVMLISLALTMSFIFPALAADDTQVNVYDKGQIKSIVFAIGVNQYFVNGQTPGVTMDAAPYTDSDRTFVPVRFLGNALGVTNDNITWEDSLGRAALQSGSTRAEMTIGKKQIVTNGQAKDIDVAPQLQPPGRTFLPARFVCEALGYDVDWQNDKYVLVWPKGEPKPDIEALKKYIEQPNTELSDFKEVKGYKIPLATDLHFPPSETIDMGVLVMLSKPLEGQYKDLHFILSSKFDSQVVDEVVAYVKQKQARNMELPLRKWSVNGHTIEAVALAGDYSVHIRVRKSQ